MMKIYLDEDGYVTFPDGSRYKGGLHSGIPDGHLMCLIIFNRDTRVIITIWLVT